MLPPLGWIRPRRSLSKRRLAGAVRAEDGEELALLDRKAHRALDQSSPQVHVHLVERDDVQTADSFIATYFPSARSSAASWLSIQF